MRNKFTIGVWSDTLSDTAVVRSMVTLISERAEDEWTYSDSPKVDFLLVGKHSIASPEAANRFGTVLACLAEDEETTTCPASLTVVRPLRFMPFMDLLQEASKHLGAVSPSAAEQIIVDSGPGLNHQELANALQNCRINASAPIVSLMSKSGRPLVTLNYQCKAITSPYNLSTLMRLLHSRVSHIEKRNHSEWESFCKQSRKTPLETFFWNLGRDMGIYHGLAPWLGKNTLVQLNGWPDFGQIKATQDEIKLCALLSRGNLTPSQLTAQSKVDSIQVNGFLNSASLCDLLVSVFENQPASFAEKSSISDQSKTGQNNDQRDAIASTERRADAGTASHVEFQYEQKNQLLTVTDTTAIDTTDTSLVFKLKRWPPIATMAKDAGRIRVATILSRQAISLKELASLARVESKHCEIFLQTLAQYSLISIEKRPTDLRAAPSIVRYQDNNSGEKMGAKVGISLIRSIRRRFGLQ